MIDLAKIDDIQKLKAMAYDRMATIEGAQNDLKLINTRIAQIAGETKTLNKAKKK